MTRKKTTAFQLFNKWTSQDEFQLSRKCKMMFNKLDVKGLKSEKKNFLPELFLEVWILKRLVFNYRENAPTQNTSLPNDAEQMRFFSTQHRKVTSCQTQTKTKSPLDNCGKIVSDIFCFLSYSLLNFQLNLFFFFCTCWFYLPNNFYFSSLLQKVCPTWDF